MAKIGQADSRWIVSRRSDGKNVDNWHWTEKDLFPLCKKELEKAFKSLAIPSTNAKLKINKADSVEGDMNIFNRKGKAKFIFDVQLKLGWEGELKETVKDGEDEKKKLLEKEKSMWMTLVMRENGRYPKKWKTKPMPTVFSNRKSRTMWDHS